MADPLLLPGTTNPAVVTLRALLAGQMPDDLRSVAMPQVYDTQLVQQVIAYQKRVGLEVDGKVGFNTWTALRSFAPSASTNVVFTEDEVEPIVVQRDSATKTETKSSLGLLLAAAAAAALFLWG